MSSSSSGGKILAKIKGKVITAIDSLSAEEIENALNDDFQLVILIKKKRQGLSVLSKPDANRGDINQVRIIMDRLDSISDSRLATEYLSQFGRRELEATAKALEVFVSRIDKTNEMIEKIINSTVLAKLNTRAILGKDRKD